MTQITLHFSETLIRRAVKAFWWRTTGWSYFFAVVLVLGSFCYALWTGDRSWWMGVSGIRIPGGGRVSLSYSATKIAKD